ncbi:hypothetical protein M431DRAFT_249977 [Trichoderma harzianum CBS 226.95]|uniref:Transmembrane protein n=1 Tax=Trichoderma harzianum CBS 226.95 TaxID=983964 RepID=A0A2T3ZZU7_TRIHA|nr:hypothetical protein M431DRAFT_249977 [Trichoderma harzianum CBS 226.95]PTB50336.1 hypothetical protein M431DRAFT_249977 [Trichoderma harzianum CBS 226.95]
MEGRGKRMRDGITGRGDGEENCLGGTLCGLFLSFILYFVSLLIAIGGLFRFLRPDRWSWGGRGGLLFLMLEPKRYIRRRHKTNRSSVFVRRLFIPFLPLQEKIFTVSCVLVIQDEVSC